jgi:glutaredoxin
MRLKFYYKPGCWFCDNVEEMLNGLKDRLGLDIEKIDITSDDELYELYRFDIPVIEFQDGSTLHGRIRKRDLMKKIGGYGL